MGSKIMDNDLDNTTGTTRSSRFPSLPNISYNNNISIIGSRRSTPINKFRIDPTIRFFPEK